MPQLALRKARPSDLDAITDTAVAGWPDDPGCDYKFPYRKEYPDDFWRWTRVECESYLSKGDKFAVMVVVNDEDRAIAFGIWDLAVYIDSEGRTSRSFSFICRGICEKDD